MNLEQLVVDLRLNAENFARGLESAMTTWESFGGSLMKIGAGLSAALTVPIVGLGQAAMKMGTQLQQAEIAFGTMLGSAELAGAYLEELKQFAAQTPFEFAELVPAAKRLMALGFAAEETIPMLKALGNAAAGLGGGAPLIQRLGLALGQMRAKAKVSAEEMRQLAEAGIPAWEMLAKAMGKTTSELMKLSEKGQVSAAAAIPLLIAGINEKFGGLMEGFMATAMGQYSNVKDQLGFVLADIGKALLPIAALLIEKFALPAVSALRDLAGWFSKLNESTKMTIIALAGLLAAIGPVTLALGGMGYMYAPLISGAARVAGVLIPMFGNIATAIQTGTVGSLALAETQLLKFVGVALPAIAAVAIAFAAWQIPAVREKLTELWEVMKKFYSDTIAPFVSGLVKIGEGFVATAATAVGSGLKEFLDQLSAAMKSDASVKFSASLNDLSSAISDFGGATKPLREALGPILETLIKLRVEIFKFDVTAATEGIKSLTQGFTLLWNTLGISALTKLTDEVNMTTASIKNFQFFFLQGVDAIKELSKSTDAEANLAQLTLAINASATGVAGFVESLKILWNVMIAPQIAVLTSQIAALRDVWKDFTFFFGQGIEAMRVGWYLLKNISPDFALFAKVVEIVATAFGAMVDKAKGMSIATSGQKAALVDTSDAATKLSVAFQAAKKESDAVAKAMVTLDEKTGKFGATAEQNTEATKKMEAAHAALVKQLKAEGRDSETLFKYYEALKVAEAQAGAEVDRLTAKQKKNGEEQRALGVAMQDLKQIRVDGVKVQMLASQAAITEGSNWGELKKKYAVVGAAVQTLSDIDKKYKEQLKDAERQYNAVARAVQAGTASKLDLAKASVALSIAENKANPEKMIEWQKKQIDNYTKWAVKLSEVTAKGEKMRKGWLAFQESTNDADFNESGFSTMDQNLMRISATSEMLGKNLSKLKIPESLLDMATEVSAAFNKMHDQTLGLVAAEKFLGIAAEKSADELEEAYKRIVAARISGGGQMFSPKEEADAERRVLETRLKEADYGGRQLTGIEKRHLAELTDANKAATLQSKADLEVRVENEKAALDRIVNNADAAYGEKLQRLRSALEAELKLAELYGGKNVDVLKKQLEATDKELAKLGGTYKGFWSQLGTEIQNLATQFASQMGSGLFTALLGRDRKEFNKGLKQQESDLNKSLADRTEDWEQYQVDVKTAQGDAEKKYRDTLASERSALDKSLAERAQEYNDYAKEVDASIGELRGKYARDLADELSDLRRSLDDEAQSYRDYVSDVSRQLLEVGESHRSALAQQLSDLDRGLAEQAQSYQEYVNDVNRSLSRLGEDYQENLSDETKSTEQAIADRRKEYGRDAQDAQKQLDELFKAGKTENDKEVKDLRQAIVRKSQDLGDYERERREALAEYTDDAQRQLARETEDINTELAKRRDEYAKYVAETQKNRQAAVQANSTDLAKEEAALYESLAKRAAEWAKFQAENSAAAAKAVLDSNAAQAKEEADLYASLARKREELNKFTAEIAEQWRLVQEQALAVLIAEQGDLAKQLDAERLLYDTFVADTIAKLEELKEAHRSIWDDIGSMTVAALEMMGQALMRFVTEYLMKTLLEKLTGKGGVAEAFTALSKQIKALKTELADLITGGANTAATAASGAAGAGGAAPGAAGGAGASAGTGLMGIVGVVASIVDAISSVVSNFQFAHMNTTLKLIEHEVRYSQLHLLALLEKANEFWPTGKSILDYMWSFQSKILTAIGSSLEDILGVLKIGGLTAQSQAASGPVLEGLFGSATEAVDEFAQAVTETVSAFALPINDLGYSTGLAGAAMTDLEGETIAATAAVAPLASAFSELSDTARDAAKHAESLAGTFKQVGDDIVSDFNKQRLAALEVNNPFKGAWAPPPVYTAPGPGPIAPTDTLGDAVNAINTQGNNLVQVLFDLPEAMGYEVSRGINTQGMRVIDSLAALTTAVGGGDNTQGMRISDDVLAAVGGIGQGSLPNMQSYVQGGAVKPFPSISPYVSTGPDVPVVIKELTIRSEIDGRQVGNAIISNLALAGVRL